MISHDKIKEIFSAITVTHDRPVPIGGRCESHVYYKVEDLSEDSLNSCAEYVADRLIELASPNIPELLLKLPGGFTFFAERLSVSIAEMLSIPDNIDLEQYSDTKISNGQGERNAGKTTVLITDVITTARSSLEAHTKASLRGIKVYAWACLIDRTLGPGPCPVVSAFTGAPVRVLTRIS